jgi:predicted RNA-binding protein with PIN domain
MSGPDALVAALVGLDARTWARLIMTLRDGAHGGPRVVDLLQLPASELATGAPRRELSEAIAADAGVQELLLAAPDLDPLRDALATQPRDPDDDVAAPGAAKDAGRERELRQELIQLRRQRDGAEARASVAEARAEASDIAAAKADARAAELELRLRDAGDDVTQAIARGERRSASRIAGLESSLAAARAELERVTRRAEQDGAALAALRLQHAEVVAQLEGLQHLEAQEAPDEADARPLRLPEDIHPETTEAARWLLDAARTLFVDGYNVTLTLRPGQTLEAQRRWLLDRLRPLAAQGRIVPVVVFDGDQSAPSATTSSGVEVRFTPTSFTADDDIVFSVTVTDGSVLVVTDDRELRERVRAEGANVIGGRAFLGALEP